MNIISSLERDIARLQACAIYHEGRAVHCRQEISLLKSELRQERSETCPTLEELRDLATTILALDGLTGAEIEAADEDDQQERTDRDKGIAAFLAVLKLLGII